MDFFDKISSIVPVLEQERRSGKKIGFVPTMGALHAGHLALLSKAKEENDYTVCSIYVNPTQFNNPDDYEKYPRHHKNDLELLEENSIDAVFIPDNLEMYKKQPAIHFDFGSLDKILEGMYRPGHFSGVALIVTKLFNIIGPKRAYFGQKDYQQFKIIELLKNDLMFDIELICVPTVRDKDGLALSSRNLRLDEAQRAKALVFYQSLLKARTKLADGISWNKVYAQIQNDFTEREVKLEYFELVDRDEMQLMNAFDRSKNAILLTAGYVDDVRLIDNLFV